MRIAGPFREVKHVALFLFIAIVLVVVYFVESNIFMLSEMQFNAGAEPLRVAMAVLIAVLSAFVLTLWMYKQKHPIVCRQTVAAAGGNLLALLITACPKCTPLLLLLSGIGGAAAVVIANNSLLIEAVSVILLLFSIWLTAES